MQTSAVRFNAVSLAMASLMMFTTWPRPAQCAVEGEPLPASDPLQHPLSINPQPAAVQTLDSVTAPLPSAADHPVSLELPPVKVVGSRMCSSRRPMARSITTFTASCHFRGPAPHSRQRLS